MLRTFTAAFSSVVLLLLVASANSGLDEELVFYLTFDNVTDQRIVDESGNGLDAEIVENTKIVKGKYGEAIHITDEGLNCVNIPSQEKVQVTGEITMMAWIYYPETWKFKRMLHWLDKGCHAASDGWKGTYGIGSSDIGKGPEIVMFFGYRDKQGFTDRHDFGVLHKMDEKNWHHVAGSYDGKTTKIYLDGKIIGKEKKELDFVGNNNAGVRIGCAKNKPQYSFVNGSIDEAAVWQRALSDDEIKQAMTGNFLAVSPSDKVATTWADMKKRSFAP